MRCEALHPAPTTTAERIQCWHGAGHEGRHGNGPIVWGSTVEDDLRTRAETAERERDEARREVNSLNSQRETARAGEREFRRLHDAAEAELREARELLMEVYVEDSDLTCAMADDDPCGYLPQYGLCWNHRRVAFLARRRTGEPPAEPTAGTPTPCCYAQERNLGFHSPGCEGSPAGTPGEVQP